MVGRGMIRERALKMSVEPFERIKVMDRSAVEENASTLMFPSLFGWIGVRIHGKTAWSKLPNQITSFRIVPSELFPCAFPPCSTLRKQQ